MSEHNKNSQQLIDEITRIRRRMGDLNRMHHRNIQEQLELAMCKMMEFLNEKPQHIEEYIKNLRSISTDYIGQALLDNMLEQIKQIKAELNSTIELPDDDPITVLDDANKLLSKKLSPVELSKQATDNGDYVTYSCGRSVKRRKLNHTFTATWAVNLDNRQSIFLD